LGYGDKVRHATDNFNRRVGKLLERSRYGADIAMNVQDSVAYNMTSAPGVAPEAGGLYENVYAFGPISSASCAACTTDSGRRG
jgi:hypothetical protein